MDTYGYLPILPFILTQWNRWLAQDPLIFLSTCQNLRWVSKYDNQLGGSLPQVFLYYLSNKEQT